MHPYINECISTYDKSNNKLLKYHFNFDNGVLK